jgi:RsmE family RNA methyltransferase
MRDSDPRFRHVLRRLRFRARPIVNLILFEPSETTARLPLTDRRAEHLLRVLRRQAGDAFDCGLVNGPRGKGVIEAVGPDALTVRFAWETAVPLPEPVTLLAGLPRPQTARDILRETAALGVSALHFVLTDKGEPSYAQSTLWSAGEWRRHLIAGAEQAFTTRLPEVYQARPLPDALSVLPPGGTRLALDNYEASDSLGRAHFLDDKALVLAIGAERGWSGRERDLLREHQFRLVHLGARVLRTETATIAALSIVRAKLGLM